MHRWLAKDTWSGLYSTLWAKFVNLEMSIFVCNSYVLVGKHTSDLAFCLGIILWSDAKLDFMEGAYTYNFLCVCHSYFIYLLTPNLCIVAYTICSAKQW